MSSNPSATPSLGHRLSHSILTWVVGAIVLALLLGSVRLGGHPIIPKAVGNVFATFSDLFSQFLNFAIPLIIIGLVTPAIADLGRGAGKWLGITTALAYTSTLFAGFLTFLVCAATFPRLLAGTSLANVAKPEGALSSYFTVEMPPPVEVMTALLLSFIFGIGLSLVPRGVLRKGSIEFRAIITRLIERMIIPLLPLHIFGIFLNLTYTGAAGSVMKALLKVVVVVLILEVVILAIQFIVAGVIGRKNPLKALLTMLPAYLTALGTSSSAATIPVTLRQTRKNGVSDAVASFTIPLCATIHLAGSTSKIFSFAFAIVLTQDDQQVALMIATYIALDSFGTATNVTGDGAIAIIVDRMAGGSVNDEGDPENARELSFDGMAYLDAVSVEGVVSPEELEASASATRSGE